MRKVLAYSAEGEGGMGSGPTKHNNLVHTYLVAKLFPQKLSRPKRIIVELNGFIEAFVSHMHDSRNDGKDTELSTSLFVWLKSQVHVAFQITKAHGQSAFGRKTIHGPTAAHLASHRRLYLKLCDLGRNFGNATHEIGDDGATQLAPGAEGR